MLCVGVVDVVLVYCDVCWYDMVTWCLYLYVKCLHGCLCIVNRVQPRAVGTYFDAINFAKMQKFLRRTSRCDVTKFQLRVLLRQLTRRHCFPYLD